MQRALARAQQALYRCNYCARDISSCVRIKCAVCPDFDLCLECFRVGAEVAPHKSHHAYRVIDYLSFPIYNPGACAGRVSGLLSSRSL